MLLTRCVRCLTCKGKRKSKYKARLLNFSVFTNYMYVIESSSARLLEHFKIVYSWVSVQVINFIIWNSKVQATIINFWFFFSFCSLNVVNNLENLKPDAITLISKARITYFVWLHNCLSHSLRLLEMFGSCRRFAIPRIGSGKLCLLCLPVPGRRTTNPQIHHIRQWYCQTYILKDYEQNKPLFFIP